MQILSLIAHPRSDSFCHAISKTAVRMFEREGHRVIHHDLYAEGFDPCLTAAEAYTVGDTLEDALARLEAPLIKEHRDHIRHADALLVVHPNWWGKPPAILADWMDRVLVPGVAYRLDTAEGRPEALLSLKKAVVFNTSDTDPERERRELGDPLESIWTRCVLPYCGADEVQRHVFRPVVGSSDATRARWLSQVEEICETTFAA